MSHTQLGSIPSHVPPAASATVLATCVVAAADVCTPAYIVLWHIHIVFVCPTPFSCPPPPHSRARHSIDKMPRLLFRANCSLSWKNVAATCNVQAVLSLFGCVCVCVLTVCRVGPCICVCVSVRSSCPSVCRCTHDL